MIINPQLERLINSGSAVRAIFELGFRFKSEGKHPIDLSIGNPDIKPPQAYYQALEKVVAESRASNTNFHGYMPNSGYYETKIRIASDLNAQFGLNFKSEHIFMTVGAANALDVLLSTLIEPVVIYSEDQPGLRKTQDEIILIAPYFVEYSNLIKNNQGKQITVHATERYGIDLPAIERSITANTRAIILNSPNNPSGAVYSEEELIGLAKLLKQKNSEHGITIAVIEDASYGQIVFKSYDFHSLLPHYRYTFFVASFSKSLGLAGERIGFFAVHPKLAENEEEWQILLSALVIHLRIKVVNAPALQQRILQKIGMTVKVDTGEYEQRANRLADALEKLAFQLERPKGGFYLFSRLPPFFQDEEEFRRVAHAGDEPLLYVPGFAFGGERYRRHIRLSVCASREDIERACYRLKEICQHGN